MIAAALFFAVFWGLLKGLYRRVMYRHVPTKII